MKRPSEFTLRKLLSDSARAYGKHPALRYLGGRSYSYAEVGDLALRFALRLRKAGLKAGDRVGLLSESRPEWGIAYLGITASGFVAVPILPDFMSAQIAAILEHSGCSALVLSGKLAAKVQTGKGSALLSIDIAEAADSPPDESGTGWDSFPAPRESDLAAILYTSGTTGKPKGVMLSHRALAYDSWGTCSMIRLRPRDRFLSILPIAHAYECTVGFLTPFAYGCSVTYLDRPPSPSILIPALGKVRPTVMLSVPLVIEKIVRGSVFPKLAAMRLPSWKPLRALFGFLIARVAGAKLKRTFGGKIWFFGIGGAALAADVEDFLRKAGFPYAIGYGMTEAAPLIAGDHPKRQVFKATGRPLGGVEIRIAEPTNAEGEGEIQVKGPIVMDGYYREPGLSREAFTEDGWLRTGDLGRIDGKGVLSIRGRIKTMILGPSGENIYPEEIEALINAFDFVEESVVYGDHEEGLTALVQLKPDIVEKLLTGAAEGAVGIEGGVRKLGEEAKLIEERAAHLLEALRKGVNSRLAAFSRLTRFIVRHEPFEKTPSKKIKRDKYPPKAP